jgi:DNA-binding Xre family transcriptional regulator
MATVANRFNELRAEKARREGRKITLSVVSQETGISIRALHRWGTNSVGQFTSEMIVTLCDYFGVGIEDLLVIQDNDPDEEHPALAAA